MHTCKEQRCLLLGVFHEADGVAKFDDFEVAEVPLVSREANKGADLMPALNTGGTRVDVEEVELLVVLHLEDMAVPTDEELGWTGVELVADAPIVATWVTADVGHEHVSTLARPAQQLGEHATEVATIAVSDDGSQGTEGGETVGELDTTDVTSVPDLVALCKVLQVLIIPETMGITQ